MKALTLKKAVRLQVAIIALALVSGIGSIIAPMTAKAAAFDDWSYHGWISEGFFSNGGAADPGRTELCGSASGRCPVLPNGDYGSGAPFYGESLSSGYYRNESIPSATRAFVLVGHLKGKYESGSDWEKAGAAFIAHTMLGRGINHPQKSRTVSAGDWSKLGGLLESAAKDGRINWSSWISSQGRDTMMHRVDGRFDVVYNTTEESRVGLEIKNKDGSVAYRMWYECANPIGYFDGLKEEIPSTSWNVKGYSYVKKTGVVGSANNLEQAGSSPAPGNLQVAPQDNIAWYHDIRNWYDSTANATVTFRVDKTGFPAGYNTQPNGTASGSPGSLFIHEYPFYTKSSTGQLKYTIKSGDVGKRLCQSISWTPGSSGSAGRLNSEPACVDVPYKYTLEPNKPTTSPASPTPGTTVNITNKVDNDGPTKSPADAKWEFVTVVVKTGEVPNKTGGGRVTGNSPCGGFYPTNANVSCEVLRSGTKEFVLGGNPIGEATYSYNVPNDMPVGTKVCFGLSVQPHKNDDPRWKHSDLECITVSKRPSLNVTGGDVVVGRSSTAKNIKTSLTTKTLPEGERRFGSWGEYGLTASGFIDSMASGAGLSGGRPIGEVDLPGKIFCGVSFLTISNAQAGNTGCGGTMGGYSVAATAPSFASAFPSDSSQIFTSGSVLPTGMTLAAKNGIYRATGAVEVRGGTIPVGNYVVINAPEADITITQDIRYDGGAITKIQDIPQVVIIAKTITIARDVQQVDAWLIANGTNGQVKTCDVNSASDLRSTFCEKPLKVNGPVATKKLYLYRTAGAGNGDETRLPGETFNLRPDAYLWATAYRSGSAARLQTVMTTELPPRY